MYARVSLRSFIGICLSGLTLLCGLAPLPSTALTITDVEIIACNYHIQVLGQEGGVISPPYAGTDCRGNGGLHPPPVNVGGSAGGPGSGYNYAASASSPGWSGTMDGGYTVSGTFGARAEAHVNYDFVCPYWHVCSGLYAESHSWAELDVTFAAAAGETFLLTWADPGGVSGLVKADPTGRLVITRQLVADAVVLPAPKPINQSVDTGSLSLDYRFTLIPQPIPEPPPWLLGLVSAPGVIWVLRRRRAQVQTHYRRSSE